MGKFIKGVERQYIRKGVGGYTTVPNIHPEDNIRPLGRPWDYFHSQALQDTGLPKHRDQGTRDPRMGWSQIPGLLILDLLRTLSFLIN